MIIVTGDLAVIKANPNLANFSGNTINKVKNTAIKYGDKIKIF